MAKGNNVHMKEDGYTWKDLDKSYWEGFDDAKNKMEKRIAELETQIEKMRNCGNCKYGYCGGSSISIDKDGNRTFHNWNEEKQAYCDIGKNGKYQCWEIEEND